MEVKPVVLCEMEPGKAMEPMKGKWSSSRVDLEYTELFCIPVVQQCPSCLVTVVFWTLWCFIKHIEDPYMFHLENGIALHPVQGIWGSSPAEWYVSWDF